MLKRKTCLVLLFSSAFIAITIVIIPFFFYNGKKVHLSFDDCYICLKDLSTNNTKYNSIFEHPFFADLKEMHDATGAKFTLYTYEEVNDYNISQLPEKYVKELSSNCDWLKIGYHAKNPSISKDSIAIYQIFAKSYTKVDSALISKSIGDAKASSIRLHFFYATQEEVAFLKENGVKTLLAADDNRISYSLLKKENDLLIKEEELVKNGIRYVSTDLRIERDNLLWGIYSNLNDNELVVFTHEWAYRQSFIRWKYKILIKMLNFYNCLFVN